MNTFFQIFRTLHEKILKNIYYYGRNIEYLRTQGMQIGENCEIYSWFDGGTEPWLIRIGNNVTIAPGAIVITHDGASRLFRNKESIRNSKYGNKFGPIEILDNCFIGMNAIILPGVKIGPNSIVGSGSVVTKNVPDNVVFAGNPARKICTLDEYIKKYDKYPTINSMNRNDLRKELTERFW